MSQDRAALVEEAVLLGYQIAAQEHCLGQFMRVQQAVNARYKLAGLPVPMSLSGSGKINESKLQAEYQ